MESSDQKGSSGLATSDLPLARRHLALMAALALYPVLRMGGAIFSYTAHASDIAITTLALFVGAAWHIWRFLGIAAPGPRRSGYWVGVIVLAGVLWQLAWVSSADFWFFRVGLVAIAVGWSLVIWDWPGLLHGWRVIAAFAIWSIWCDGVLPMAPAGFTSWLAVVSAKTAGMALWAVGASAKVVGNVLSLDGKAVSVGLPCTAIPLIGLLWILLVMAALLMRLRWLRVVLLAAGVAALGYLISIVRIILLLRVAGDPERFAYWHYGQGSGWFTAGAILVLSWALSKSGGRLPIKAIDAEGRLHLGERLGWGCVLAWVFGVAGHFVQTAHKEGSPVNLDTPPTWSGADLIAHRRADANGDGEVQTNRFSATWRADYLVPGGPGRLQVIAAYVPVMISGDPRNIADAAQVFDMTQLWTVKKLGDGREASEAVKSGARLWLATVRAGGETVATKDAWRKAMAGDMTKPGRWVQWLAHRQPMRDKRAYWLAITYAGSGNGADRWMMDAFKHWTEKLSFD